MKHFTGNFYALQVLFASATEEAERRIDELDSGKAEEFPGEKVFAEIRTRLRK